MQPKIGLALSAAGAKGFAHLGLIKVLHQEKIPIDMISGSSMGALIACCYAASRDIDRLIKFAILFQRKAYFDYVIPRRGFIRGEKVKQLMMLLTHGKNIEDLSIPVSVVATDITRGEQLTITSGNAAKAIRASIAIPGVFIPEKQDDRLLIDGGVLNRLPIEEVKDLGADIIIASDVSNRISRFNHMKKFSIFDVIIRSLEIMQTEQKRHKKVSSDVFVEIDLKKFSASAFTNIEEMINMGEREARKQLPLIMNVIESWKIKHEANR